MKNILFDIEGNTLIANLQGELDHHNISDIRKEIEKAMSSPQVRNLVLDYSNVTFMDSSGIGLAMGRYNTVNDLAGTLVIVPGSKYVSRVLGLSGIFGIVHKSTSSAQAVSYIGRKGN